jgi:hypothetical protein
VLGPPSIGCVRIARLGRATIDCSFGKWVGIFWRIEHSQRWLLSDSVPPHYTDGSIRKKSHGSEEFLPSYDYQLEDLPKGAIWRKHAVAETVYSGHARFLASATGAIPLRCNFEYHAISLVTARDIAAA